MRPKMRRGRWTAVAVAATILGGMVFVAPMSVASAAPPPSALTNYGTYPNAPVENALPQACLPGTSYLRDVSFSLNGGSSESNLSDLPDPQPGDTITMTWSGWNNSGEASCEEVNVGASLSVKAAPSPVFNQNFNQQLHEPFAYCGPSGDPCQGGAEELYSLSLTMPPTNEVCNYQLDAVIGLPLQTIGPDGSFYGNALRQGQNKPSGPDMLISAKNGGPGTCTTVEKIVSVNPDEDPDFPADVPGDPDYLICLTPLAEDVQADAIDVSQACPPPAIPVIVKAGQSETIALEPGATYTIQEILEDGSARLLDDELRRSGRLDRDRCRERLPMRRP